MVVVSGSPLIQEVAEFEITFVFVPILTQVSDDWHAVFCVTGPLKPPSKLVHLPPLEQAIFRGTRTAISIIEARIRSTIGILSIRKTKRKSGATRVYTIVILT